MTVEVTGNELLSILDNALDTLNGNSYVDVFAFADLVEEAENVNYALSL